MKNLLLHRKITLFVLFIIILASMFSYDGIPKQEGPEMTIPYALVTTVYPGASQETVDLMVTSKIEEVLFGIEGFDYSTSYSSNNVSVVVLALDYNSDILGAYEELKDKMVRLQPSLPEGCQTIQVNDSLMETAGMIISLSGEAYTYEQLGDYAIEINEAIGRIDGVRRFDILGTPIKQLQIQVDESRRGPLNITYDQIVKLLRAEIVNIPIGTITEAEGTIQLEYVSDLTNIEDFNNLIIGNNQETGTIYYLKDIADIKEVYAASNYKMKQNGDNAILLAGYFQSDQNVMTIGEEVASKIEKIKKTLPSDLIFDEVTYLPDEVSKSINDFLLNLGISVLLVILVVFIGMGFRNAIIVSVAIPVSILATVLVMPIFGIQIHQITIAAFIVALGMLVDNAIVVSDAIQVEIDSGEDRMTACIHGTKSVMIPVLTSTITTIAAFSPLLFLNSIAGEYVKALPQIAIISLIASYGVAIFITPVLAYIFFKENKKQSHSQHFIRKFFEWMLVRALGKKFIVVVVAIFIMGGAVYVGLGLDVTFFPKVEKNILYIDVQAPDSTSLDQTEIIVDQVSEVLSKEVPVINYTASIGSGLPRFYDTLNVNTIRADKGQLFLRIDLEDTDFESNTAYLEYLQSKLDESEIKGNIEVKQLEYIDPRGAVIGLRVSGEELERVEEVSTLIASGLKDIKGTMNVQTDQSGLVETYNLQTESETMTLKGLMHYHVQNELNIALMGQVVGTLKGASNMPIEVIAKKMTYEELEDMVIVSEITGEATQLKEVVDLEKMTIRDAIKKHNGDYAVYVGSDLKLGTERSVVLSKLQSIVADIDTTGVVITYDGENEKISEYFGEIGVLALFAALAIYLILLVQFKSFLQPFVILSTIPLAAVGSVIGLRVTQQPVSFTAALGIVSLMGIVVNNAIVLLDYINFERDQLGKTVIQACLDAVQQRFRPIMLSTITTIIGLIPLTLGNSELFKPMAIALMSGLMVATVLTLVIIPVIYNLLIREDKVYEEVVLFKLKPGEAWKKYK